MIDYALAGGNAVTELIKLGALIAPPSDTGLLVRSRLIAVAAARRRRPRDRQAASPTSQEDGGWVREGD